MTIDELHKEATEYCDRFFEGNSKHPAYDFCFTAFINGAKLQERKLKNTKFNAVRPDFGVPLICKGDSGIHPLHNNVYFRRIKLNTMEITKITSYRDGGTIEITTNDKVYCIDRRIGTSTIGTVYEGYPNKGIVVENQEDIKLTIGNAVMRYYTDNKQDQFSYQKAIVELLKM